MRRNSDRTVVGDLAMIVENDLFETGGKLLPTPAARDWKGTGPSERNRNSPSMAAINILLPTPNASDGSDGGQHPDKRQGHSRQLIDYVLAPERWGKYGPAIARWEAATRPAPHPTEPNTKGNPRLNPAFSEWMMGWPAGWVTDLDLKRAEILKIIGNGVVTQQAYAALTDLVAT